MQKPSPCPAGHCQPWVNVPDPLLAMLIKAPALGESKWVTVFKIFKPLIIPNGPVNMQITSSRV